MNGDNVKPSEGYSSTATQNDGNGGRTPLWANATSSKMIDASPIVGSTTYQLDVDKYLPYIQDVRPNIGQEDLDLMRARNQSAGEKFLHALNQAISGELVGGTIRGIGSIFELPDAIITELSGGSADFNNRLIELGNNLSDTTKNATPIYRQNPNKAWDTTDAGWWFENAVSLTSALSLMIPGLGVTKGGGLLMKGLGLTGKLSREATEIGKALTMAITMRNAENMTESATVVKDGIKQSMAHFEDNALFDQWLLSQEGQQYLGAGNEPDKLEASKYIASKAGWRSYAINSANIVFDFVQASAFLKANYFTRTNTIKSAAIETKLLGAPKSLLEAVGRNITPFARGAASIIGEGIEEGVNFIGENEGRKYVEQMLETGKAPGVINSISQNLGTYLGDGHLWEQAAWGSIGGAVFEGAGYLSQKLANKDGISTDTTKLAEIGSRQAALKAHNAQIAAIGKRVADGTISEEQAQEAVKVVNDGMAYSIGLQAAKAGNIDLVLESFQSGEVERTLTEGATTDFQKSVVDKKELENLKAKILRVEDAYRKAVSFFYNKPIENVSKSALIDKYTEHAYNVSSRKIDEAKSDVAFATMADADVAYQLHAQRGNNPKLQLQLKVLNKILAEPQLKGYEPFIKNEIIELEKQDTSSSVDTTGMSSQLSEQIKLGLLHKFSRIASEQAIGEMRKDKTIKAFDGAVKTAIDNSKKAVEEQKYNKFVTDLNNELTSQPDDATKRVYLSNVLSGTSKHNALDNRRKSYVQSLIDAIDARTKATNAQTATPIVQTPPNVQTLTPPEVVLGMSKKAYKIFIKDIKSIKSINPIDKRLDVGSAWINKLNDTKNTLDLNDPSEKHVADILDALIEEIKKSFDEPSTAGFEPIKNEVNNATIPSSYEELGKSFHNILVDFGLSDIAKFTDYNFRAQNVVVVDDANAAEINYNKAERLVFIRKDIYQRMLNEKDFAQEKLIYILAYDEVNRHSRSKELEIYAGLIKNQSRPYSFEKLVEAAKKDYLTLYANAYSNVAFYSYMEDNQHAIMHEMEKTFAGPLMTALRNRIVDLAHKSENNEVVKNRDTLLAKIEEVQTKTDANVKSLLISGMKIGDFLKMHDLEKLFDFVGTFGDFTINIVKDNELKGASATINKKNKTVSIIESIVKDYPKSSDKIKELILHEFVHYAYAISLKNADNIRHNNAILKTLIDEIVVPESIKGTKAYFLFKKIEAGLTEELLTYTLTDEVFYQFMESHNPIVLNKLLSFINYNLGEQGNALSLMLARMKEITFKTWENGSLPAHTFEAEQLASLYGVQLGNVVGTGTNGKVTINDVRAYIDANNLEVIKAVDIQYNDTGDYNLYIPVMSLGIDNDGAVDARLYNESVTKMFGNTATLYTQEQLEETVKRLVSYDFGPGTTLIAERVNQNIVVRTQDGLVVGFVNRLDNLINLFDSVQRLAAASTIKEVQNMIVVPSAEPYRAWKLRLFDATNIINDKPFEFAVAQIEQQINTVKALHFALDSGNSEFTITRKTSGTFVKDEFQPLNNVAPNMDEVWFVPPGQSKQTLTSSKDGRRYIRIADNDYFNVDQSYTPGYIYGFFPTAISVPGNENTMTPVPLRVKNANKAAAKASTQLIMEIIDMVNNGADPLTNEDVRDKIIELTTYINVEPAKYTSQDYVNVTSDEIRMSFVNPKRGGVTHHLHIAYKSRFNAEPTVYVTEEKSKSSKIVPFIFQGKEHKYLSGTKTIADLLPKVIVNKRHNINYKHFNDKSKVVQGLDYLTYLKTFVLDTDISYLKNNKGQPLVDKRGNRISNVFGKTIDMQSSNFVLSIAPKTNDANKVVPKQLELFRKVDKSVTPVQEDVVAVTAWWERTFGKHIPLNVELANVIIRGDVEAWGVFENNGVTIASGAVEGTAYHEAFHVVFNMFLSEVERAALLNEVTEGENNLAKEEYLAERFREYMLHNSNKPSNNKIYEFFKRLLTFLKQVFTGKHETLSDRLFKDINSGKFNRPAPYYGNNIRFKLVDGFTAQEQNEVIGVMTKAIIDYMELNPSLTLAEAKANGSLRVNLLEYLEGTRGMIQLNEREENLNRVIENYDKFYVETINYLQRQFGIDVTDTVDSDKEVSKHWDDTKMFSTSEKEGLLLAVKRVIMTTPSNTPGSFLGLPTYLNFNKYFPYIRRMMAGATTTEEMIARLEHITQFDSSIGNISARLRADKILANAWFSQFSKQNPNKSVILVNQDSIDLDISNKRSGHYILSDGWTDTFKLHIEAGDLKDKVEELTTQKNTILELIKTKDNARLASEISTFLKIVGVNLTPELINKFFTNPSFGGTKAVMFDVIEPLMNATIADILEERVNSYGRFNALAELAIQYHIDLTESSSLTVTGESVFGFIMPNYLSDFVSKFSTVLDKRTINKEDAKRQLFNILLEYAKDPAMLHSNWLFGPNGFLTLNENQHVGELTVQNLNLTNINKFGYTLLDGMKHTVLREGVQYGDMTDGTWQFTKLAMYMASVDGKTRDNVFMTPILIPSDSGNIYFIQAPRVRGAISNGTIPQFIDNRINPLWQSVKNTVYQEIERMIEARDLLFTEDITVPKKHKLNAEPDDPNYVDYTKLQKFYHYVDTDSDGLPILMKDGKPTGRVFQFHNIRSLNTLKVNAIGDEYSLLESGMYTKDLYENEELLSAFDKEIDAHINKFISELVTDELAINGKFKDNFEQIEKSSRYFTYEQAIAEFAVNSYISNVEQFNFFIGQQSEYKNDKDTNKRAKEIASPKLKLAKNKSHFVGVTLKDVKVKSRIIDTMINSIAKGLSISEYNIENIKNNTPTTPDELRIINIVGGYLKINSTDAQGYITLDRYEYILKQLGRLTPKMSELIRRMKSPSYTPKYSELREVLQPLKGFYYSRQYDSYLNKHVSVQVKYSSMPLIPSLVYGTDAEKLYRWATRENIDELFFESAEKVGTTHTINIVKDGKIDESLLDKYSAANGYQHRLYNNDDWGLQLDVPDHIQDTVNKLSTQLAKVVFANIEPTTIYNVDGDNMSGADLIKSAMELMSANIKEDFESVLTDIGAVYENGVYIVKDKTKLSDYLKKEVERRSLNSNYFNAIEITEKNTKDFNGFQGYKGGFDPTGKGTPEGDEKDKAMRRIAESAIVALNPNKGESSSLTSLRLLGDPKGVGETILLAINGSYGKPLERAIKDKILKAHNEGSEFVVGDMPSDLPNGRYGDDQFINYLQEIGAKFTIYHAGNESRIQLPNTNEVELDFNVPLYASALSTKWESVLTSIFANNVTDQKIAGGSAVVTSTAFLTNGLSFENVLKGDGKTILELEQEANKSTGITWLDKKREDKTLRMYQITDESGSYVKAEILIPPFSKNLFDKTGKLIDINLIPEDIRTGYWYRIPYEGKHSGLICEVVGFLPVDSNMILLPAEAINQSGEDMDVDKRFGIVPVFDQKDGVFSKHRIGDENSFDRWFNESFAKSIKAELINNPDAELKRINTQIKRFKTTLSNIKSQLNNLKNFRNASKETILSNIYNVANTIFDADVNSLGEVKVLINERLEETQSELNAISELYNTRYLERDEDLEMQSVQSDLNIERSDLFELIDAINKAYESFDDLKADVQSTFVSVDRKKELVEKYVSQKRQYIREQLMAHYEGLSPIQRSTKSERNNKLLDIIQAIYGEHSHYTEIMSPSGFVEGAAVINEVDRLTGADSVILNPTLNRTQDHFRKQNISGRKLKGMAADSNAFLSVAQVSKMELRSDLGIWMKYPKTVSNLDTLKSKYDTVIESEDSIYVKHTKFGWNADGTFTNVENNITTKHAGQTLAQILDIVKEGIPYNMNTYTFYIMSAMLNTGIPMRETGLLVRQPILYDIANDFFNNQELFSDGTGQEISKKKMDYMNKLVLVRDRLGRYTNTNKFAKYIERAKLNKFYINQKDGNIEEVVKELFNITMPTSENTNGVFSADEMAEMIKLGEQYKLDTDITKLSKKELVEFENLLKKQILIGERFLKLKEAGEAWQDIINAVPVDRSGIGPTIANRNVLMRKIERASTYNNEGARVLVGDTAATLAVYGALPDIFGDSTVESVYPVMQSYMKYGYEKAYQILSPMFLKYTFGVDALVRATLNSLNKEYTEELANTIANYYIFTEVSKLPFFANADKEQLFGIGQSPVFNTTVSPSNIYNMLGNTTKSNNVIIQPVYQNAGVQYAKSINGVFSLRVNNTTEHFGNPFSSVESEIQKGLIKTNSTKESVEKYIEWILSSNTTINPEQHKFIRQKLMSGELKNKPIVYYKELEQPSHATALDYLINKYEWKESAFAEISVANQLMIIKQRYADKLSNTTNLLNFLEPKLTKNDIDRRGVHTIDFINTMSDDITDDEIIRSFNNLWNGFIDDVYDEDLATFAKSLVRYNYFYSGFGMRASSISKLIPNGILHEIGYVNHIRNLELRMKNRPENYGEFFHNFVRANSFNSYIVPVFNPKRQDSYTINKATEILSIPEKVLEYMPAVQAASYINVPILIPVRSGLADKYVKVDERLYQYFSTENDVRRYIPVERLGSTFINEVGNTILDKNKTTLPTELYEQYALGSVPTNIVGMQFAGEHQNPKDGLMFGNATQFIGSNLMNIKGSTTALFAKLFKSKANTGEYTADDLVMISVQGRRGNIKPSELKAKIIENDKFTGVYKNITKAILSGATVMIASPYTENGTPIKSYNKDYNIGDMIVRNHLNKLVNDNRLATRIENGVQFFALKESNIITFSRKRQLLTEEEQRSIDENTSCNV